MPERANPALTAIYDQALTDANKHLNLLLVSIGKHTAGYDEVLTVTCMSMLLTNFSRDYLGNLLLAALIRLQAPYPQEALDAAAAELARQQHGGPADPDDIRLASDMLGAAFAAIRKQESP